MAHARRTRSKRRKLLARARLSASVHAILSSKVTHLIRYHFSQTNGSLALAPLRCRTTERVRASSASDPASVHTCIPVRSSVQTDRSSRPDRASGSKPPHRTWGPTFMRTSIASPKDTHSEVSEMGMMSPIFNPSTTDAAAQGPWEVQHGDRF